MSEINWEIITPKIKELRQKYFYKECGGCQFRLAGVCSAEETDYCRLFCDGGYTCTATYEWLQHCQSLIDGGVESFNEQDVERTCSNFSELIF